jgi:hypothetical protein
MAGAQIGVVDPKVATRIIFTTKIPAGANSKSATRGEKYYVLRLVTAYMMNPRTMPISIGSCSVPNVLAGLRHVWLNRT